MRFAVAVVCAVGCTFHPGVVTNDDGAPSDAPKTTTDGRPPIDASIDAPIDAPGCPAGFAMLPGAPSRYRIYGWTSSNTTNQSRSFGNAAAACAAQGAHLAIADSAAEANALAGAIPVNPASNYFWDGVTDGAVEDVWLTVLGAIPAYLPWEGTQPNGGTSDNCGLMSTSSLLYDWACNASYPFACECE